MLVNKTNEKIVVQYNGIEKEVLPGGNLDVREFDISTGQTKPLPQLIVPVEKHIMKEFPGVFEVTKTIDDPRVEKEYSDKINSLTSEIKVKDGEIGKLKAALKQAEEKNAVQANEINGFGDRERGLKSKISKLEKELENTIEDHEAQMARIRGGKAK